MVRVMLEWANLKEEEENRQHMKKYLGTCKVKGLGAWRVDLTSYIWIDVIRSHETKSSPQTQSGASVFFQCHFGVIVSTKHTLHTQLINFTRKKSELFKSI